MHVLRNRVITLVGRDRARLGIGRTLCRGCVAGAGGGLVVLLGTLIMTAKATTYPLDGLFVYGLVLGSVVILPVGALVGLASAALALACNRVALAGHSGAPAQVVWTTIGAIAGTIIGFLLFWQIPFAHTAEWWIQLPAVVLAGVGVVWLTLRPERSSPKGSADLRSLGDYYKDHDG